MVCSVLIALFFTDWITLFVASNFRDKIAEWKIIKRLFRHMTHGNMTSQLGITWQRGKTIAKHLFTCVSKLANGMAQNYIWRVNLSALCAFIDIFMGISVGWKNKHIWIISVLLHSAIQHGNHHPCWIVVSMLDASWSYTENIQQPCGFVLLFLIWLLHG